VLSPDSVAALAAVVCRGETTWRLGPQDETVPSAALGHWRDEVTHVIDLRDGADVARSRWRGAARRQVARAEKAGVTVRRASESCDWAEYFRLYERTVERWGTPLQAYDHRLFELVPQVAGDEALLLLAERSGEACAGAIVFVHGRHAGYWHGASDVHEAPGSANALHWHALEVLEHRGVESYDLLGSGPLPGVVRFKESIGGVPQRVRAVERSKTATKLVRLGRRMATRRRTNGQPSR
jgi:lipid II:glycine glycyltransferase (peptidoglycan interpeptide bridge formation enzyme)